MDERRTPDHYLVGSGCTAEAETPSELAIRKLGRLSREDLVLSEHSSSPLDGVSQRVPTVMVLPAE